MKKILLLIVFAFTALPLWADVSPKPEMEFTFIYRTAQTPSILPDASEQIQCKDNQCIQAQPLGTYGLQKLYCTPENCFSIAYEYDHYQKLIIGFADGSKRESNIFKTPDTLRSGFKVYVDDHALTVEPAPLENPSSILMRRDAWTSFIIILVLELAAAWAFLTYTDKPYRVLYAVAVSNIITMFVSWRFLAAYISETAFLWIFCFVFESVFIWLCNRKVLSWKEAGYLGLAANVTSYSLGMMISFYIAPWLF